MTTGPGKKSAKKSGKKHGKKKGNGAKGGGGGGGIISAIRRDEARLEADLNRLKRLLR